MTKNRNSAVLLAEIKKLSTAIIKNTQAIDKITELLAKDIPYEERAQLQAQEAVLISAIESAEQKLDKIEYDCLNFAFQYRKYKDRYEYDPFKMGIEFAPIPMSIVKKAGFNSKEAYATARMDELKAKNPNIMFEQIIDGEPYNISTILSTSDNPWFRGTSTFDGVTESNDKARITSLSKPAFEELEGRRK